MGKELRIIIKMEDAAFVDNPPEQEVGTILRHVTHHLGFLSDQPGPQPLFDSNGNKCGTAEVVK